MIPAHQVAGPAAAPVLVLAASLGTDRRLWQPQLSSLVGRFRVVAVDRRGHGASAALGGDAPATVAELGADLVDLLDGLGVERAHVCGVSLGGMEAMWLAAHHPARVDRLVLACTAPALPPREAWHDRAAAVRASGTAPLVPTLLGRWFTPGFAERRPDVRDLVAAMLAATDPGAYAACCEAIGAMDLWAEAAALAAPTLVVAGAADPVVPPPLAVQLQQAIAGAGLTVLAGAAHLPGLERPDAFTAAVLEHLLGTPAERGDRTRREVLGDGHVERARSASSPFTEPFQDFITRFAWGDVWTRPGLGRRERSVATLAALTALGRTEELALHVRAALRNGLTPDEVGEVLLHTAVYAGVPAANTAFAVARRVLEEMASEVGGS
jgi:3-oxoadipate enol-lactonase/4-carboxymuconolactone decarboxylase